MRLTKFNPETGQYEYKEPAKTQEEFIAQRKAVIQRLGELEENAECRVQSAEWISVKDRMPATTLKNITICDQDIGSGAIVSEKVVEAQVSEIVAVICSCHIGGEVKEFLDYDNTVDGSWANTMGVTHWMPLPQPPKMKGENDEQR
jgi:hypothetical protein